MLSFDSITSITQEQFPEATFPEGVSSSVYSAIHQDKVIEWAAICTVICHKFFAAWNEDDRTTTVKQKFILEESYRPELGSIVRKAFQGIGCDLEVRIESGEDRSFKQFVVQWRDDTGLMYQLDSSERKIAELFLAVTYNHQEKIKQLIKEGVDPNSRDLYGRTAVYQVRENPDLFELLKSLGLDLNLRNNDSRSVLDVAKSVGSITGDQRYVNRLVSLV